MVGCGLSFLRTRTPSAGPADIVGVAGGTMGVIVGLEIESELGGVRCSYHNGTGFLHLGHRGGVFVCSCIEEQT